MRYVKLGGLLVLAAVAAALIVAVSRSAGHPGKGGAITIQSWLHAKPSVTGLSATVSACMKLDGAFVDQGGEPTWNDETDANPGNSADKCDD